MKNSPFAGFTWTDSAREAYDQLDPDAVSTVKAALREAPLMELFGLPLGRRLRMECTQEVIESTDPSDIGDKTRVAVTLEANHGLRVVLIRSIEQLPAEDITVAPRPAVRSTVGVAVRIAGATRPHLRNEWASLLAGCPEEGFTVSARRQRLMALGFLAAALRMRMRDMARPAWRPVDWLLGTANRTNGLIAFAVGAQTVYIVGHQGIAALATGAAEPCALTAGALYALARWLRKLRGIDLASTTREPADE
ncbi:hypothetical protein [Streptomyces sp. NPDC094468]|uniref:hypothetical protein n=1 Tax=Streptomyces sp. NPDC094468 TaxID=3366066 RepID=UPI003808F369